MNPSPDKHGEDPSMAAAWREMSDELPPPPLDARILAAAHRAVGSAPQTVGKPAAAARDARRWRIPLAAAASLCVVALGFLLTRPQQPVLSTASMNAPPSAPAPASAPAPMDAPLVAREESAPTAKKRAPEIRDQAVVPPPSVADEAEQFKQADSRLSANAMGNLAERDAARNVGRSAAAVAAPTDTAAAIERIRQFHAHGKLARAAQALRALRLVDPEADRQLPVELRAWAATVKP